MFFKKAILAVLLSGSIFLVLSGCKKREEETADLPDPGEEKEEKVIETPKAFEAIPDTEPTVYISESPCTIEEYVEYRGDMGYEIPDSLTKEGIDKSSPIKGLEQAEAERFAVWQLARIPSEREWSRAGDFVDGPYPWDGLSPRENAPLFLVRDWLEGTEGEQEARQERRKLMNSRLEQLEEEVFALHEDTKDYIDEVTETILEEWGEVKKELFSEVESYKNVAEKNMLVQRGEELYEGILSDIQKKKLPLRTMKRDDDYREEDWEKALSAYINRLEELRNHVPNLKTQIIETNSELSEEVRKRKESIEQLAEGEMEELMKFQEELPQKPDSFSDIKEAVAEKQNLNDLREEAQDISERIEKQLNAFLERIIPQLGEELDSDFDEEKLEEVGENLRDREETITRWSEHIGREFEQEEHLFKDLRDLKRFRARQEALKTEMEMLEEIAEEMQQQ